MYTFNLDNFYNDENLTKVWTGAKFQTEAFNGTTLEWTGVVNNDTVTPVDNTEIQYGESSGVYNGTYDFRNDDIGGDPEGFTITETGGTVNVIAEKDDHKKVLEFYDDDPDYRVDATNEFATIQIDATIEFWWSYNATETLNHYLGMQFKEGSSVRFYLFFNYLWGRLGSIQYRDSTGYHPTGYYDNPINTMIHIKLIFDDTNNEAEFIVGGVNYGELPYFSNSTIGIDNIFMFTRTVNGGGAYWHWIDAIGYSADPDYTIGENLYPDNFNMIKGSYDYTDNMKVNDASYTTFTSTHTDGYIYETPSQWDNFTFTNGIGDTIGELETIDANYSTLTSTEYIGASDEFITSVDFTKGYIASGTLENTWIDDANSCLMYNDVIESGYYIVDVELLFDNELAGRDFLLSTEINFVPGITMELRINDIMWKSDDIDFDDELVENVNKISIYVNHTSTAYARMYYFKIVEVGGGTPAELDVQVDIQVDNPECSSIEYFKYSHKTNVSATIDLDIWNWDTSTWYEIESIDNSATFDDDSFTLGVDSDYVNSSFGIRIRFQALSSSSDFALQIDRFRIDYLTTPAELEMTITFSFTNYDEDLLVMNIQSWQRTNKTQTITFKIWNYDTESYVQISSSSDTTFTKKEYSTESPSDFISPSGVVKLYWVGSDIINDFELHIDYLFIQIFYKLDLVHEKSFDTNGVWRYRWAVLGSIHYTQWVNFEVIDPVDNFHAISESDVTTRWVLQGAELSPLEDFHDDIDPSSNWDLYDVSPIHFNIYTPELEDYLIDNSTFYGSSFESPEQWDDFAFTLGAGNTVGELETDNDANYVIVDSGITTSDESYLGLIKPADSDIITDWDEADTAPHWSKLDDLAPPDFGNIRETTSGMDDRWNFNTLTILAGRVITKIDIQFYAKDETEVQHTKLKYTTSTGQTGIIDLTTSYDWTSNIHTGLNINQAELDSFWINVEPYFVTGFEGWIDIEACSVKVYTSLKQYSVDYTMTWDIVDPELIDDFYYDYRTTLAIDCDLDIYNWDTTGWLELESNTGTSWITDSYVLTDPYISGSDQIAIRFQSSLTTTDFDMELDQIVFEYNSIYTISKKHNNTIAGYMYMQTNITESVSIQSAIYGTNYTLSSGDYFEVDFQTNSDSQINVILLKDSIINKTLILSQSGNTHFNRHTVHISVDEDVEFDQLKISSIFEDTDYVKIYDIKTKKYTLTGDYKDFYVGSKRTEDVYLNPDIYNLRIFEEGTKKIDTNITIGSTDYYYVYTPIQTQYCRLTLFSTEGDFLNFEDYHVKVNRSLNGEYNQFWLLDNLFYVDVDTYVYIKVYDRFDSLIGSFERLASDYIDLEIEVYSLQIKNLQTQKTTIDINTTHVYPLLSGDSIYFMLAKDYYQIGYYDTNDVYKQFLIYLNSNQAYELNRSKICFLAFVNQKGEHLYFNDYKTYINGTLLYENVFYKEIGDKIGIEVKDIYGISIKNQTYTVISGDNYIPVVLTQYSLKVMSQQLCFNHINITRDPNYYESSYYWSEWIAPSEIIEFKLFAGYYKINLTNNEAGGSSYYSYTLSGDDILLIGSNNTIYNVLVNIANVNATIGNQITNVQIDLTNQNSQINNSIINVEINLGNINSSLGNMLVNLDVDITNIANNISNLYTFTENSFINLGNDINVSFISIENNIISINQSISNLVIGVSNDIYLINGTISTMITQLETNLLLMNVSIDTALFDLGTTLNMIGSNITNNFILLNNSIYLNNLNINDSRIAIINNLLLINNTMTSLISEVYSAVYLINNSIYTAVVDLGAYLSLMNNTIYGNLSIVLEMNEFLTELYQMTMFSDLLNWTNIGLNTSLITTQIDAWTFINNYVNQSIEVHLRYQDLIEKLVISADDSIEQYLPNKDVEYNLWSVSDGEYVDEWKALDPDNKTVNFGFFEEDVPYDPTPIAITYFTLFIALIFFVIIILGVLKLYYTLKERRTPIPPEVLRYMNKKSKKKIDGVVDNRI